MPDTMIHTDNAVSFHKEAVIELLGTHWDEFVRLMAGKSQPDDSFPEWFYEFSYRLSECMNSYYASKDVVMHAALAHQKGLLGKASVMHNTKLKHRSIDTSIGMEDGLFVVQSHQPSSSLDSGFQHLVDSVL